MDCEHNEGWVLDEGTDDIVVHVDEDGDYEADFVCNRIGCEARKRFKFKVTDLEEVK